MAVRRDGRRAAAASWPAGQPSCPLRADGRLGRKGSQQLAPSPHPQLARTTDKPASQPAHLPASHHAAVAGVPGAAADDCPDVALAAVARGRDHRPGLGGSRSAQEALLVRQAHGRQLARAAPDLCRRRQGRERASEVRPGRQPVVEAEVSELTSPHPHPRLRGPQHRRGAHARHVGRRLGQARPFARPFAEP
jgi:hypothetical protein